MIENLKYLPIYWMDGMKINKNHFTDLQNFIIDSVRDSIGIHTSSINYGLLPVNDSLKIKLIIDQHKTLKVIIEECQAITPNGSRIDISYQNRGEVELPFSHFKAAYEIKDDENTNLMVCLSVSLFNRVPFGESDPDENPPRYPYTRSGYVLQLIAENEFNNTLGMGAGCLTLAKILINDGEATIDKNYIPPCVNVNSHKKLINLHNEIDRFYRQIELYASQIRQKIRVKKQNNLLSLMVDDIANQMISYLGTEISHFRLLGLYASPIHMFSSVITLARVFKNCLDVYTGSGKEELLNYLMEWYNISQGDFELIFSEVLNVNYNHNQIDQITSEVDRFIRTVEEVFSILNQLDYIGKKRDGSVFVCEIPNDKETIAHPKRSQSFLAD